MRRRRPADILAAGLLAVSLSGCGLLPGDGEAEEPTTQPTQEAPADGEDASAGDGDEDADGSSDGSGDPGDEEDGTAGDDQDDVAGQSAQEAGIDLEELGEPVATGEIPAVVDGDDSEAVIDVEFYGLERRGEALIATYAFTVDTSSTEQGSAWLYHYLGDQSWTPHLIDSVNLTKHEVLRGAGGVRTQTDYQGTKFRPGQTFYAYAMFAAPPEDVSTMDAFVIDGMPVVPGVEIS